MFVDSKLIFQDRYFGDIDALFGVDICNQPHLDFAHAFAFAPLVMNLVTLRRVKCSQITSYMFHPQIYVSSGGHFTGDRLDAKRGLRLKHPRCFRGW